MPSPNFGLYTQDAASELHARVRRCDQCHREMLKPSQQDRKLCEICVERGLAMPDPEQAMQDRIDRSMDEILTLAQDKDSSRPRLEELVDEIVDYFGGVRQMVRRWGEQFDQALERYPGRASNLTHFLGIWKIIEAADRHQHEIHVANMTDEQIRNEQKILLLQMLSEEQTGEGTTREKMIRLLKTPGVGDPQ